MTGREKPKRKALHRGLDDIVNRDASLTSRLLGRAKRPAREPLEAAEEPPARPKVRSRPRSKPAPVVRPDSASMTFEEFVTRWSFLLRSGGRIGKLRICEVLYENTFGAGRETFFTSYEKLARLVGLEKKQCAINVRQLESLGFIERLNIYNTATKQGTEFKLHLEQLSPHARHAPRYRNSDEE